MIQKNMQNRKSSNWTILRQKLTVVVCICACLILLNGVTTGMYGQSFSEKSDQVRTVVLTEAEADSILTHINGLELKNGLLKVDLWEAQQRARIDSTFAADHDRMLREYYESRLREQDNWLERIVKHPIVWFSFGAYLGIEASK